MPANGAARASAIRSHAKGAPVLTAATASAPRMPTPIKNATRPMPEATTTANSRAHGVMIRVRLRNVSAAAARVGAAAALLSRARIIKPGAREGAVVVASGIGRDALLLVV